MSSEPSSYLTRPCYPELIAILLMGFFHVALELLAGAQAAYLYNVVVSLAVAGYLGWRIYHHRGQGLWRAWGFQAEGFWAALLAFSAFAIPGAGLIFIYGHFAGTLPLPRSFWYILALYPVWGIAQQFALQNLLARHLCEKVPSVRLRSLLAATGFSLAHFPEFKLMLLTFGAGIAFTWIYHYRKNLWALGLVHGGLGSLAFYLFLGEDPWAAMVKVLAGSP